MFIVDVSVRNSQALRALDADLDAALASQHRRLLVLQDAVGDTTNGHQKLAESIDRVNGANGNGNGNGVSLPANGNGTSDSALWGVRGPKNPGGRSNPMTFVQESGQAGGLGDLAAATGASSVGQPTPVAPVAPVAVPSDQSRRWLTSAADSVAQKVTQPEDDRVIAAIESAAQIRRNTGDSLLGAAQSVQQAVGGQPALAEALASVQRPGGSRSSSFSPQEALAAAEAVRATQIVPGWRSTPIPAPRSTRSVGAGEAAGRLGVPRSAVYDMAAGGQLPGAVKQGGQWVIPEQSVLDMLAAGGSGGGGGRRPPVAYGGAGGPGGGPGGGGGGRRSLTHWNPVTGLTTDTFGGGESAFSLGNLLRGNQGHGGAFGLPSFGSIGSLGGLGLEHWILSGLGVAASAGSAVGGAGLLGTAGLTQMLAGGGSDALASKATITNAKALYANVTALQTAVKTYGADSAQAAAAQDTLTASMRKLNAVSAEVTLDKSVLAIKALYAEESKGAQTQSAEIMTSVVQLATSYVPLVTSAAQRNLSLINTGLKPLFAWLEGPQGIQIFDTLENAFARDLPTSIHAFDMGLEDFLRLMAAASQYTGGLSRDLDNLFSRKGAESTAQYDAEVQKLVGDLHEWGQLLKLLGEDLGGIFRQDAGTANSIVGSLTQMLAGLHKWVDSTSGQTQLHNIFEVHKNEILALLHLLPTLVSGFGSFYLDVAPPLVRALTDIAGAVDGVLTAIEKIPGGADALGFALVAGKLGILLPLLKKAGELFGILNDSEGANVAINTAEGGALGRVGAVGAGGAAVGAGERAAGGAAVEDAGAGALAGGILSKIPGLSGLASGTAGAVETGTTALSAGAAEAGFSGLSEAILSAGVAIGPVAAGLVPLLAAAGGVLGLIKLFDLFSGSSATTTYTSSQLGKILQERGKGVLNQRAAPGSGPVRIAPSSGSTATSGGIVVGGRGGALNPEAGLNPGANTTAIGDLAGTKQAKQNLKGWVDEMGNGAAVAQMTASQLQKMINEGQNLRGIFKDDPADVAAISKALGKLKDDLAPLRSLMKGLTSGWAIDASTGLGALDDDFHTWMRRISSTVDIGSDEGRKAVAKNVADMVTALTKGMTDGNVSVTAGMAALKRTLATGMQDNAITWSTEWGDMFTTLDALYAAHKVNTSTYLSDTHSMMEKGFASIKTSVTSQYQSMFANLKAMEHNGNISHGEYVQGMNAATGAMLGTQKGDMTQLGNNVLIAMQHSRDATLSGVDAMAKELNQLLKPLGATLIPVPSISTMSAALAAGGAGGGGTGLYAGGKVTRPTYMVGEEAPTHPEFVLATNPAYRQRNLGLWSEAGHHLGIPGFAKGGSIAAGIAEANLLNSKDYPYEWGGGHNLSFAPSADIGGGPGTPGRVGYDCSGSVSAVLHAMGLLGAPLTSAGFGSYGLPGPGPVTLYVDPGTHVFMSIDGRFFGTHGNDGPGWYDGSALPGFEERHPPGVGSGSIAAPKVTGSGALPAAVRAAMAKGAKAANSKLSKAIAHSIAGGGAGGGDVGTFSGIGGGGGVEKQVAAFFGGHGFDKVAIAGLLGNAWQESSFNVNEAGGGFWQQISNFGQGTGGTLLNQMTVMLGQIGGLKGALNAAGSPGAAATLFMDDFEKPNAALANLPRRIAGANAAYAGGFANGGFAHASTPTLAMFGENGGETAMFVPDAARRRPTDTGASWPAVAALLSAAIGKGLAKVTGEFNAQQTSVQTLSSLTGLLQGLAPGTSLKSIGLSGATLKHSGLTAAQARALVGGGPAGYGVLAQIDAGQEATDRSELSKLKGLYAAAVQSHNKKLEKSILGQISTIDGQLVQTVSNGTAAILSQIQTKGQNLDTIAGNIGNASSILGAVENLTPGTSLASMGLTPAVLKTLGLPSNLASLEGTGNTYLSGLQTSQGGSLTPAQIASATAGNSAANSTLQSEINAYAKEMAFDEASLPKLTGSNETSMKGTIGSLESTISGLMGSIQSNNDALTALTTATTTNTAATTANTGSMTGSTAFQYNSGTYLGSDRVMSLGVGS